MNLNLMQWYFPFVSPVPYFKNPFWYFLLHAYHHHITILSKITAILSYHITILSKINPLCLKINYWASSDRWLIAKVHLLPISLHKSYNQGIKLELTPRSKANSSSAVAGKTIHTFVWCKNKSKSDNKWNWMEEVTAQSPPWGAPGSQSEPHKGFTTEWKWDVQLNRGIIKSWNTQLLHLLLPPPGRAEAF